MSDDDEEEIIGTAPRRGCLLFTIPVLLGFGLVGGYLALFVAGVYGRPADGPRVSLTYRGCAEAEVRVRARIDRMGLGDPRPVAVTDGFGFEVTMPADVRVAAAIPATLARPGTFQIVTTPAGEVVLDGHIDGTSVHVGAGDPVTLVRLDDFGTRTLRDHMQAHPEGKVAWKVDGEVIGTRSNLPAEARGQLELEIITTEDLAEAVALAAERDVILGEGPLPCEVTLTSPR